MWHRVTPDLATIGCPKLFRQTDVHWRHATCVCLPFARSLSDASPSPAPVHAAEMAWGVELKRRQYSLSLEPAPPPLLDPNDQPSFGLCPLFLESACGPWGRRAGGSTLSNNDRVWSQRSCGWCGVQATTPMCNPNVDPRGVYGKGQASAGGGLHSNRHPWLPCPALPDARCGELTCRT